MPLIELLRPEQRAWLRKLRRRIANRELMRRLRADIDRKLLCPGVDLPIEAGTCGRLIPRESSRCIRCHNRRRCCSTTPSTTPRSPSRCCSRPPRWKTTHPRRRTRPPTRRTPSRCSTTCPLSAIPACAGSGWRRHRRRARYASARTPEPLPASRSREGRPLGRSTDRSYRSRPERPVRLGGQGPDDT